MSNISIALAHELGNHIDDISEFHAELDMPDAGGELAGNVVDSEGESGQPFFIAVIKGRDGRDVRVRVTCEELA